MTQNEKFLRYIVSIQGLFYFCTNIWALVATRQFLLRTNPDANMFEARSFAAVALVLSLFFLAGVWRKDLLKPAAFLGLGTAIAIVLVQIFHLPDIGWSLLWVDTAVEATIAGSFITVLFFREDDAPAAATEPVAATAPATPTVEPQMPPLEANEVLTNTQETTDEGELIGH